MRNAKIGYQLSAIGRLSAFLTYFHTNF